MWGNRYFSWVGSKFTEGGCTEKNKRGKFVLLFLSVYFITILGKICGEIGSFHGMVPSLLREAIWIKLGTTGELIHEPQCLPVARLDHVNLAGAAPYAVAQQPFSHWIVRIILCARQGLDAQYNVALDPNTPGDPGPHRDGLSAECDRAMLVNGAW